LIEKKRILVIENDDEKAFNVAVYEAGKNDAVYKKKFD